MSTDIDTNDEAASKKVGLNSSIPDIEGQSTLPINAPAEIDRDPNTTSSFFGNDIDLTNVIDLNDDLFISQEDDHGRAFGSENVIDVKEEMFRTETEQFAHDTPSPEGNEMDIGATYS